jgi:hypothetical protein
VVVVDDPGVVLVVFVWMKKVMMVLFIGIGLVMVFYLFIEVLPP